MIRLTLTIAALGIAAPLLAQSYADLAAVDRMVAEFTGAPQGSPGGAALPVDRRLRLTPCRTALFARWYGTRQDTVEVSCPVPGGWKLYVLLTVTSNTASAAAAPVVMRGDAVTITVSGEGFAVTQNGEALESGAVGTWIKVRGPGQGAPVLRARVLRPGVVGMELP